MPAIHLPSSHHVRVIISHHHRKGEYNAVRYFERHNIHIIFIALYGCTCSILLSVVVNLSLFLIHKLNFITGTYTQLQTVYIQFSTIHGFRHRLGVWESIPRG